MSRTRATRVFILGAGCSAAFGYPLGRGLRTELREFLGSPALDRCPTITRHVKDTVDLLAGLPKIETLDRLAKHVTDELDSWRQREGGVVFSDAHRAKEYLADKQILDAKIAISTMFLARE